MLVAVHDPKNLSHLQKVLEETNPVETDVVVISINGDCPELGDSSKPDDVLTQCETKVFSRVVHVGEKAGKPAFLIAIPGKNAYELILLAASRLRSSRVVMSLSQTLSAEEQENEIAQAWDNLPRPRPDLVAEIIPDGEEAPWRVELNHNLVLPSITDRDLAYRLWRSLNQQKATRVTLHEGSLYGIALRHLEDGLRSGDASALNALNLETAVHNESRNNGAASMP